MPEPRETHILPDSLLPRFARLLVDSVTGADDAQLLVAQVEVAKHRLLLI